MAARTDPLPLDPARDTLLNVSAFGAPVPSARFMGGRAYDIIRGDTDAVPTAADRAAVVRRGSCFCLPLCRKAVPLRGAHTVGPKPRRPTVSVCMPWRSIWH